MERERVKAHFVCSLLALLAVTMLILSCAGGPDVGGLVSAAESGSPAAVAMLPEPPIAGSGAEDEMIAMASLLQTLTLEQKIGQRFITWLSGTTVNERNRRLVSGGYVGGVILNDGNIRSSEQVTTLIEGLQEVARHNQPALGLLVAVDQEGGRVARFRLNDMTRFPPAQYWARMDERFVRSVAYITGSEISRLGCNVNMAPVLDLYGVADNTVIGDRSFGSDPDLVGRLGAAYIAGARAAGVVAVAKHFPGHGATNVDSHKALPIVTHLSELQIEDALRPFRDAIDAGAEALMTAHVLYEDLDPDYPATLSRKIIGDLLRDEMGFQGVVISDAIEMDALTRSFAVEEILALGINAGVDLILVNGKFDVEKLIDIVKGLVDDGTISAEEIDRGVMRVLRLKAAYGLVDKSQTQEKMR